jgi:hypothetical protein
MHQSTRVRCVEDTRFVAPPRYPYVFEVTVNITPPRGAT